MTSTLDEGAITPEPETDEANKLGVPFGRRVELPGRGTTFVREVAGPPGAPTLVLLHGWIATGAVNWQHAFGPLSQHFRILAPDHRGHGRGLRNRRRFRMADCADDVAALMDQLEVPSAVMVGYSMGGPIAQLMWHRHPDKVDGLVLCATAHAFVPVMRERLFFVSVMSAVAGTTRMGQAAAVLPTSLVKSVVPVTYRGRPTTMSRFVAAEMGRHDWRLVMEAGVANGRFNAKKWIGDVDVPTAVVVTTKDRAIEPSRQLELALAIEQSTVHKIAGGHVVCAEERFGPGLVSPCLDVATKAYPGFRPMRRAGD